MHTYVWVCLENETRPHQDIPLDPAKLHVSD